MTNSSNAWPELDWTSWKDTAETLHMMTQIVGKTRLALTPLRNHWWNVALYVTARGLTTSAMDLPNGEILDIEFDLIADQLVFRTSLGQVESLPLKPQTVADFLRSTRRFWLALASPSRFIPCRLKLRTRFASSRTRSIGATTPMRCGAFGMRWATRTESSSASPAIFTGKSVPCISSGVRSTWQ